jgi:hypothetical protein
MKLPRVTPVFRPFKFAPFALISIFFFTNVTGILFSHVLAPVANANSADEMIPPDIPTSGDKNLDMIIFRAGEREGVDPRFIHACGLARVEVRRECTFSRGCAGPYATNARYRETLWLFKSG